MLIVSLFIRGGYAAKREVHHTDTSMQIRFGRLFPQPINTAICPQFTAKLLNLKSSTYLSSKGRLMIYTVKSHTLKFISLRREST